MSRVNRIGIVAESVGDFESLRILIKRMIGKPNFPFERAVAHNCSRLQRKVLDFSINLNQKGCDLLVVVHDLDRLDVVRLRNKLQSALSSCPISNRLVCIPIEELEAWFLSDPVGVKKALNLKRTPKIKGNPEEIKNPKEKLGEHVRFCSEKTKFYLNTKNNPSLAAVVSIDLARQKCPSFNELFRFVKSYSY